ncbi:Pentatricopeptide repeat-containing protein [Diplonema papillatum]|nr:Pentatricopeptide repeat-containing protein [Diplonema papillatum]|eukprot:gene21190-32636_t
MENGAKQAAKAWWHSLHGDSACKAWLAYRHSPQPAGKGKWTTDHRLWRQKERSLTVDLKQLRTAKKGVGPETVKYAISLYGKYGHARQVIDGLALLKTMGVQPGAETYKDVLKGLCEAGRTTKGDFVHFRRVFDEMLAAQIQPDTQAYALLIRQLRKDDQRDLARETVAVMLRAGVAASAQIMNEVILSSQAVPEALAALKRFGALGVAPNSGTLPALLRVCCTARDAATADFLLENRANPTVSEFDSLMRVHDACTGLPGARRVLTRMEAAGVRPETSTYCILLVACASAGRTDLAEEYFRAMAARGLVKSKAAVGSMMQVYAAAGDAEKADELLAWSKGVNIPPSETTLRLHEQATSRRHPET